MSNKFGEWLGNQRAKSGLTLDDLAEHAGTGKGSLWMLEKGRTVPRLDTAAKVTAALGVPLWKALKACGDKEGFAKASLKKGRRKH